mmetsp:Transcript_16613/g.26946  ORF Transcript_16613/g.26946 Transcript_16613/m.26946 type:complete len:119 (-) Transcript_16613:461-817(-)
MFTTSPFPSSDSSAAPPPIKPATSLLEQSFHKLDLASLDKRKHRQLRFPPSPLRYQSPSLDLPTNSTAICLGWCSGIDLAKVHKLYRVIFACAPLQGRILIYDIRDCLSHGLRNISRP